MKIQYDARVLSSLALFVDHKLLEKGEAYTNASGAFYPIDSNLAGMYAYSLPYKQIVNDASISGANIMSGVYLDGQFITPGQSGLYGINHYNGVVYFTGAITNPTSRLSGRYAYKDFSVKTTDETDFRLLFGQKYLHNQKYAQNPAGIEEDVEIYPIIYIRPSTIENKPFAFAGVDDNTMVARCVIIADNTYNVLCAANILKNTNLQALPIYDSLPFGPDGIYTGQLYNYNTIPQYAEYRPIIWKVKTATVNAEDDDLNLLGKKTMFVDFELRTLGAHS